MAVRRWFAGRKRRRLNDIWPILPGSERPPAGWPGWPEGRQFAFVLTHDVEGPEGLARVRPLAELEMSLGFRSSFNFIPEGDYRVPKELRAWLVSHGFEVGVHDLRHDGNLFRSRQQFSDNASRINAHLHEWGAVGFRAGFMLHQLDWLHDLNIQYDCSTFDTDPFEPQPHGQHTIFPFWVACPEDRRQKTEDSGRASVLRPPPLPPLRPGERAGVRCASALNVESSMLNVPPGNPPPPSSVLRPPSSGAPRPGYVELPYTLPQDSTLLLLLREPTPAIWLQKLDWIAQHGGMALVNVHPDYVQFPGEPPHPRTFPVQHYRDLLERVRALSAHPWPVKCIATPPGRSSSALPSADSAPISAFQNVSVSAFEKSPCWHALPKDVAAYARKMFVGYPQDSGAARCSSGSEDSVNSHSSLGALPGVPISPASPPAAVLAPPATRARTLMFVENHYPQDTRVRNEASLLAASGYQVTVVCLRKPGQRAVEDVAGVQVYRLPRLELFQKTPSAQASRTAVVFLKLKSFLGYLFEYAYFTSACFILGCFVCVRRGFDVIHVHNPPDTLFLVGLPFKLLGKKFIFDHHDLCPELYQSRYGAKRGIYTALLAVFEWCSLKLADVTIATNETYKEKQIQRAGKSPGRIFVVRNGPNQERMQPRPPAERLRQLGKTILCYIGSLNPQDGVDYLLRSLRHLRYDLKRDDFYCVIMGSGDSLADLRALAAELKLEGSVELTGFISDQDLLENLAAADICVDPDPSSPLNDVSTWIKIMEYMACGKPIVSFDLKESRYSARDAALWVTPNDELAFAKAIARLMDDPGLRQTMGSFGRERVQRELQWSVTGQNLLAAYQSLFPKK